MRDLDKPYVYVAFPFVSKGPKGEEQTFDSEGEVPAGWTLPNGSTKGGKAKSETAEKPAETPAPVVTPEPSAGADNSSGETAEVDADGTPFDATMHTGTKTKAGLWRMKVGVKRPEKPAALDL